jgi:hypothetical protein
VQEWKKWEPKLFNDDEHFGRLSFSTNDGVIAKLCDMVRAN